MRAEIPKFWHVNHDEPFSKSGSGATAHSNKRLERWFDVKITITDEAIKASRFTATFQNKDINHVLETLAFTSDISYKVVEKIDPATGQKYKIIQLMKTP